MQARTDQLQADATARKAKADASAAAAKDEIAKRWANLQTQMKANADGIKADIAATKAEVAADRAERLGVSRQTVNALETGKYDPSLPLAFKIARLFDRHVEEIFLEDTSDAPARQ